MNRFQLWYTSQPRALRALLTINVVLYVVWVMPLVFIAPVVAFVESHLALNPWLPKIFFEPWQLVTYNFLHLGTGPWGFLHMLFNMLWLYWVAREYEEWHGAASHLAAYLLTGIGGGLVSVLVYQALGIQGIIHGASASVIGVMMVTAIKHPHRSIGLLFIGNVRLIHLVLGLLVLDLLFLAGSGTAITAHYGGALFGYLFAKAEQRGIDLSSWAQIFFPSRRRKRSSRDDASVMSRMEQWLSTRQPQGEATREAPAKPRRRKEKKPVEVPPSEQEELDRILEKISAVGYEGLTEEEKHFLYEASRK